MASTRERDKPIDLLSQDEIDFWHRNGYTNNEQHNRLSIDKAHSERLKGLEDNGFTISALKNIAKTANEEWEKLKQTSGYTEGKDFSQFDKGSEQYKNSVIAGWHSFMLAMSPLNAFLETFGDNNELTLMRLGVDPGAARVFGIASEVVGGLLPVGKLAKSTGRTIEKVTGAETQADRAAKASEMDQMVGTIRSYLEEGLRAEGVRFPRSASEARATVDKLSMIQLQKKLKPQLDQAFEASSKEGAVQDSFPGIVKSRIDRILGEEAKRIGSPVAKMTQEQRAALSSNLEDEMVRAYGIGNAKPPSEAFLAGIETAWNRSMGELGPMPVSQTKLGLSWVQEQINTGTAKAMSEVTGKEAERIMNKIAKQEGLDLEKLFERTGYTNKQMYAYLTVLRPHVTELSKLAKKAVFGSNEDKMAFTRYAYDLFNAKPHVEPGTEVSKDLIEMLTQWDPQAMAKGDITKAMDTFANDIGVLDLKELRNLILGTQGEISGGAPVATVWAKTKTAYRAMLLPFAWSSAFVGNSVSLGIHETERVTGRMFGTGSGVVPDLSAAAKDAYYFNKGLTLSIGNALTAMGTSAKGGYVTGELSRFDSVVPAFTGKMSRIIQTPENLTRGMDNLFGTLIEQGATSAQLMAWAERQGMKGKELGEFVTSHMNEPWRIPSSITENSAKLRNELTFQSQLGFFAKGGVNSNLVANSPLFFYAPFMKSYINLAKFQWNRTPGLQFLSYSLFRDIKQGGPAAEAAVGRLIMGNLLGMFYYNLAREGYITGSGPIGNKAMMDEWLINNKPYSFKLPGGGHLSYKYLEPATAPIGFMADLAQVASWIDEPTLEQMWQAGIFGIINNFAAGNWWQTGTQAVQVLQEYRAGRGLSEQSVRTAMSPVTSVLSGGAIGGRAEKIWDPALREARGMLDEIGARTPFFSDRYRTMTDPYGDPISLPKTPGNPLFGLIAPWIKYSPKQENPIKKEGGRIGAKLPNTNDRHLGGNVLNVGNIMPVEPETNFGIELTDTEQEARVRLYQRFLQHPKDGIAALIGEIKPGGYNDKEKTTMAGQRMMFSTVMKQNWDAAGKQLILNDPKVARRFIEAQAKPKYPFMQPEEQEREKMKVEETIQQFERLSPQERENFMKWNPPQTGTPVTNEDQSPMQQRIQVTPQGVPQ